MKKCTGPCRLEKELYKFSKCSKNKDGLKYNCKDCDKINLKKYYGENKDKLKSDKKEYYIENKESILIRTTKYTNDNKDKISKRNKIWYENNKEKVKIETKLYRVNNKEKTSILNKNWKKDNRPKCNASYSKYRANKLQATPKWLTKEQFKEIEEFYKESNILTKETGVSHQVDHIVPLQGKNVSGLHVPWNLRVITKEENLKKGSKCEQ